MEVKIYREPENKGLILNESELKEYSDLVNKLKLTNEVVDKTPSVYIPINSSMQKLLKALCPAVVKITEYKKSTIPVEVLKVVEYGTENNMFEGYEIWYADKDPDPLLIGWNYNSEDDKKNNYTWRNNYSLLARWGDCAMELDELLKKGFQSLKISLVDSAKEVLSVSESIIKDPDTYVRKHLKSNITFPIIEINGASDLGILPF